MIVRIINYRFVTVIVTLIAALCRAHEVWMEEMCANPVAGLIKIIGIIIVVWFLFTPNSILESKDC